MKRLLLSFTGVLAALTLASCTPAQIAAVTSSQQSAATTTTTVPFPNATPYGPATWGCPTFTYDAHGHEVYYQLNDMGYNEVDAATRATCVPIQQLIDAGVFFVTTP